MKRCVLLVLLLSCLTTWGFKHEEITEEGKSYLKVENSALVLYFNRQGGRLDKIYYKRGGADFVNTRSWGAFSENDWLKKDSRDFLYKREFDLSCERSGDEFAVVCKGHYMGGDIDFLEVTKRYVLRENSPVITVDYDFHNQVAAMSKLVYAIHIFTGLTVLDEKMPQYYMPGADGIKVGNGWQQAPTRGWLGVNSKRGTGFAVTMSSSELYNMLVWDHITVEWRYVPQYIENGKSWKTRVRVLPFTGLPKVSGAGDKVVGALVHADHAGNGDKVPVEIRLHNCEGARTVKIRLFQRSRSDGGWSSVTEGKLDFAGGGETRSIRAEVCRQSDGLTELEAVVEEAGKELTRLNSCIRFGRSDQIWKIGRLEPQKQPVLQKLDLTGFTHVQPDPDAVPWAKPLPGGKLKVLAFCQNIPQFGDLSQRMDMDYDMSWIHQGSYGLATGEYMLDSGKCNLGHVFRNMRESLKKEHDVIFIGGISWRLLPKDIQDVILAQVKAGTGLVYTGVDEGNAAFGLQGGYRQRLWRQKPVAVKRSFLTSGIPFEVFPPGTVFELKSSGDAQVKAGGHAYLTTSQLGKGKVVAYSYAPELDCSGIIPVDPFSAYFAQDRPTPVEVYFSMLAKGVLYASGREPGLSFEDFSSRESEFTWHVRTPSSGKVRWDYRITDRNNELRGKGSREVRLNKGTSLVTLKLPVEPYGGRQLLSVIVRDPVGQALNWGSWAFQHEPDCRVKAVKVPKNHYLDGEEIPYTVTLGGKLDAEAVLEVTLVDSYGRLLQRSERPASPVIRGSFRLSNGLPARFARIHGKLLVHGREVDTGVAWFYTRPAERLMVWDDYLLNSIVYWNTSDTGYRMKRTTQVFKDFGLDVLMNPWGESYSILNNFGAPMMMSSGIAKGRTTAPQKYLETGDKKYLVREWCLSDPGRLGKFYQEVDEKSRRGYQYGALFYDCGDELALSQWARSVEFCFSPHCLRNFRRYLRKRYATLEELNRIWESDFKSWSQVIPYTKEEVWAANGRHVAGWSDHRDYIDWLCADHLSTIKALMRKNDPSGRLSCSGTQPPSAHGGMDWWRLMKVYDLMQNYSVFMMTDIQRSFKDYISIPWDMGYGSKGQEHIYNIWRSAYVGSSGISMWCLYSSLFTPDLQPQQGLLDAMPGVTRLRHGVGKLLMDVYRPRRPQVAILYSQASLRAAFIEKRMNQHVMLWQKYNALCRHYGLEFSFLSYEQLAKGMLDHSSIRLLVLSDATALSEAEIEAVRRYVEHGGHVLAEGVPGTRHEDCRLRPAPALASIFSDYPERTSLEEERNTDYLKLLEVPDAKTNRLQLVYEERNFARLVRDSALVSHPVKVLNEDGTPVVEAAYYLRRGNGGWFAGILTEQKVPKQVRVILPESGHIYDVVSGRYCGKGRELRTEFKQGTPLGLVVLPEPVAWQKATVSGEQFSLALTTPLDSVAHIEVTAPDGKPVREYGKNVAIRQGKAEDYRIPFALSDGKGAWSIRVTEAISGAEIRFDIHHP